MGGRRGVDGGEWRVLDQGQVPTGSGDGPDAVIGRIADTGRSAMERRPRIASLGHRRPRAVRPGRRGDPIPRQHARATGRAVPSRPRWRPASASRSASSTTPGRSGWRSCGSGRAAARRRWSASRSGPASAASSPSTAGSCSGMTGRPARSATRRSIPTGRRAAAATTAVSRRSRGPTGSPRRAGPRRPRRRSKRPGPATPGHWPGWPRSAAISASGSATWSPSSRQTGSSSAAGSRRPATSCSTRSGRRCGDRVHTTSLAEVEVVTAQLGTWAGAIGAAIHGAEGGTAGIGEGSAAATPVGGRP